MVTIITLDTLLTCRVPINCAVSDALYVYCGDDVPIGCKLMYSYRASEGCSYSVYDHNDVCIQNHIMTGIASAGTCGGGFTISEVMAYIKFSTNASLYRSAQLTVVDIIVDATCLADLYEAFDLYNVDERFRQDIINLYLDENSGSGGSGLPLPDEATVGQYIRVKSVSTHGRVTGTEGVSQPTMVPLTQAEYDALVDAGQVDDALLYMIVRDDE